MNIYFPDNTINLGKVILWQYDNAPMFVALVKNLSSLVKAVCSDIIEAGDRYMGDIDGSGTEGDPFDGIGLDVWGSLIGFPRPSVTVEEGGQTVTRPASDDVYRRLLKARINLLRSNSSVAALNEYLLAACPGAFENDGSGQYIRSAWVDEYDMTDEGLPMGIKYSCSTRDEEGQTVLLINDPEERSLFENGSSNGAFVFPAAVGDNNAPPPAGTLGLNDTQEQGQMLENLATAGGVTGGTFHGD